MRNKFASLITQAATVTPNVCLLYADIGNRLFDKLKAVAPDRAVNTGIAEANMATMASGMASMGYKPFIYTITPFTTARNFEQIKIDIAYANEAVVIVGTGSGLSYANLGPTHHSFEDIALMRTLPNMTVVCPADAYELEAVFPDILKSKTPVYLRLGKKNEPINYDTVPKLKLGQSHVLRKGSRCVLLCTGTALKLGLETHSLLECKGINAEVVSMHTVKPLDETYLNMINDSCLVVTIEEHSKIGGFGSAIADFKADQNKPWRLLRCGIPDEFIDKVDGPQSARNKIGLTAQNIEKQIINYLEAMQ